MLNRSSLDQRVCLWLKGRATTWAALGTGCMVSLSACASLPSATPVANTPVAATTIAAQSPSLNDPYASSEAAGTVRMSRPASAIQQVAWQPQPGPGCPPEAITSCPPEPRMPVAGAHPYGIGMAVCDVACQPSPFLYPDEYLCDGGDREWPVHYGEDVRLGLDTEDTVAEFKDHHGKPGLIKSNRVCVYAPRFAAIRSVSLPHEEGSFRELGGIDHAGYGGEVRTQLAPQLGNRPVALGGMAMRSRASGLESEQLPTDLKQRQRVQLHDKVLNTFEDLNFFRSGLVEQGDLARLNLAIGAAQIWTRDQYPVIQAKVEKVNIGLSDITATALTVVEVDDRPGQLRIVKTADKKTAEVGEIVTFAIRYDNLGPNPLAEVRIVDNLTPRLEYVPDSATSEAAGRLVVEDNGEGSLILTWEFAEQLAPKSGGVVTFQARVR